MTNWLLWNKVGMSQIFSEEGKIVPVTYVQVPDNEIVGLKVEDRDGYNAVILGINPSFSQQSKKFKDIKEFRVDSLENYSVGQKISIQEIEWEEVLTITGISKGRGFSGQVKRWNRSIARKSHGTKYIRHGSTMNCAITGRTKKWLKMAGRYGNKTVTLTSRKPVLFDVENKVVAIKWAIPWPDGSSIIIKRVNKG